MSSQDWTVILVIASTVWNLGLTAFNFKMYTEFFKERVKR